MDHIRAVTESDALDHLVDEEPQALGVNADCVFFEHFEQVLLHVLEHQIEPAFPKHNTGAKVLTV